MQRLCGTATRRREVPERELIKGLYSYISETRSRRAQRAFCEGLSGKVARRGLHCLLQKRGRMLRGISRGRILLKSASCFGHSFISRRERCSRMTRNPRRPVKNNCEGAFTGLASKNLVTSSIFAFTYVLNMSNFYQLYTYRLHNEIGFERRQPNSYTLSTMSS